jgi:hypothetical protein
MSDSQNDYEDWDVERAAIMEYDGEVPRHEAERQARGMALIINRRTEEIMANMQITIDRIDYAGGNGPNMIHTKDGQQIKIWAERVGEVEVGKSYQIPYFDKDYKGVMERSVGKGIIKEVTGGNGSQAPIAPPLAPVAQNTVNPSPNTPVGVVGAAQGNRERSIQAQAIIKSVISVGGSEVDVQRWMDCHDKIVAGERVG